MSTEQPFIQTRAPQHYAAVGASVSMDRISEIADRFPEVFGALAQQSVTPVGAPFLRYRAIDMCRDLQVEAGVPIDAPLDVNGAVFTETLPGGRYAVLTHRGPFDGLSATTARLLAWASDEGLHWDTATDETGERWAGRLEIYETDPSTEPDPASWVTVLAFKLRD